MAVALPPASAGSTALVVLLVAALVLGYVVIWAIWHFWFRHAPRREDEPPR